LLARHAPTQRLFLLYSYSFAFTWVKTSKQKPNKTLNFGWLISGLSGGASTGLRAALQKNGYWVIGNTNHQLK